jgi:hypothetical protein
MATVDISAGLLPPPACYPSEQDRLDAYAAALIGNLTTGAEWATSQTAPGNPGLYWLRTDTNNRPIDVMRFSSAAGDSDFIRLASEVVFAGTASGAAGAYAVTNSPPYPSAASAYRTGQIYTFLANHTNSGASTLNVDGKGAKAITKDGAAALSANDILIGQVVTVLYDGVNFQLITQKRDLTRQSLRQFLTYASAGVTLSTFASDVLVPFTHGFVNPISGVPLIPFAVRVVLVRIAAGSITFNGVSGVTTYTWYNGQEVDCLHFVSSGTAPYEKLPSFRYVADGTNVWVSVNLLGVVSIPFFNPGLTPADYQVKVYATALNPAYVAP